MLTRPAFSNLKRSLLVLVTIPLAVAGLTVATAAPAVADCPTSHGAQLDGPLPCGSAITPVPASAATPSRSKVTPTVKTVVTPDQSRAILANYQRVNARANSGLNPRLLATVEVGPVLAADKQAYGSLASQRTTSLPTSPLVSSTVYVQVQNTWPAFFVAVETRANFNDVLLFQQAKKGAPWKVALRANSLTSLTSLNIPTDAAGYVTKTGAKSGALPIRQVSAATCSYADQVGIDQVLPTLDGGIVAFNQELAAARSTNSAKGFKTTVRCTAKETPLASLDSPDGSWVIYSVQWTEATAGVRSHVSTRSTTAGMFAALVSAAPAGPTPIAIPFATITATTVGKTLKGATGVSGPSQPAGGVIPSLWAGYPTIDPSWQTPTHNGNIDTSSGSTNVNFLGSWFSAYQNSGAALTQAQFAATPGLPLCVRSVRLGTVLLADGERVPNHVLATGPCRTVFFNGQGSGLLAGETDAATVGAINPQAANQRYWVTVPASDFAVATNPASPAYTAAIAGGAPPSVLATVITNVKRNGVGVVCVDPAGISSAAYTFKLLHPDGTTYNVANFSVDAVGLDGRHYCDSPGRIDYAPPQVFKSAAPTGHHAVHQRTRKPASSDLSWLIYILAVAVVAGLVALVWVKRRQHDEATKASVASNDDNYAELEDAGLRDGGAR